MAARVEVSNERLVPCASCGELNPSSALFCPKCGIATDSHLGANGHSKEAERDARVMLRQLEVLPSARADVVILRPGVVRGIPKYIRERGSRSPWAWSHIALLGAAAWGLSLAARFLPVQIGSPAVIRIIGYLLGAGLAAAMVVQVQRGNWRSLGFEGDAKAEVVKGAVFGLSLAGLLPIGLVVGLLGTRELIVSTFGFTSPASIAIFAIILVLVAPLAEEIYFRGILYGKLAESSKWAAVLFSTVAFVLASGAVVPVVVIFGLAVAIRRRSMTVWFAIGAHAVWMLTIALMTLYLVAGPAKSFNAGDGLYSFDHIPGWKQIHKGDPTDQRAKVDAVFESPTGEKIRVERFSLEGRRPEDVPHLLEYMQQDEAATAPQPSQSVEGGAAYESSSKSDEGEQKRVAVAPDGQNEVVVFTLECPDGNCENAEEEFEEILDTVDFGK